MKRKSNDPLNLIALLIFTVILPFGEFRCAEDDEPITEAPDAYVHPDVILNVGDSFFLDAFIPSPDVPLIPQCFNDEECNELELGECQERVCHPELLECVFLNEPDGTPCETDNLCVTETRCNGGLCIPTGAAAYVICDDENLCTNDSCAPDVGCVFSWKASGLCEDGDECTVGDYCDDGVCVSGNNTCPAQCGNNSCQVSKGENCENCALDCGPCSTGCTESDYGGCAGCGCEACVCGENPECCSGSWNADCVFLCIQKCGVSQEGCLPSVIEGCCGCDCETCVCELHPECCSGPWTDACATACASECDGPCELSCGDGVCSSGDESCENCPEDCGSCNDGCMVSEAPGCSGCACEECVCDLAPGCCSGAWSALCVTACTTECGAQCPN